jgi:four helix bundle protein
MKLPEAEKYNLTNQIIRSSRSVTANIAEGFGRYHFQENIQFCRQARGSLVETLDHLYCCLDETSMIHLTQKRMKIHHASSIRPIKKNYLRMKTILMLKNLKK